MTDAERAEHAARLRGLLSLACPDASPTAIAATAEAITQQAEETPYERVPQASQLSQPELPSASKGHSRRAGSEAARSGGRAVTTDGTRVRDVVRDVVAEVAPDELPLVEGLVELDDATAVRRLVGRGRWRERLGFGLDEVLLVTPVVWLAVDEAVQRIVRADAASRASSALRKLFRRPAETVLVPPLTREQLAEVRKSVLMAAQRSLEEERASTIADAVVARLALSGPDSPAGAAGQDAPWGYG